ncbi:ribosomal protein S18-alanine N-acetyltransferase [Myxosarcina sp. GI1(2024)]
MKILEINLLTTQEIPAVLALDRLCFGGLWSEAGYRRELDSPNSCLIALLETEPINSIDRVIGIGCFWAILREAHITLLGIAPQYRQQGLGKLLLCALLDLAVNKYQLERATLEVAASNRQALNLYQNFGFEIAGKRRKYYPNTGEDALILWRQAIDAPKFQQELTICQQQICDRLYPNYILEKRC